MGVLGQPNIVWVKDVDPPLNNSRSVPNFMIKGMNSVSQMRKVLFKEIEYNK